MNRAALVRPLAWTAGVLLLPVILAVLFIAIFGWNWLRGPIQDMATEKTGRVLAINGELKVRFGWPLAHIRGGAVTFANPPWAKEKQMVAADGVEIAISLPQLLLRNIVLPDVRLERPVVFLEQGTEGRKNWLLDLNQQDEGVRIRIDRLTLDQGRLGYDDAAKKTSIRSELATTDAGVSFSAQGRYLGLALKARGSGGPVLGMRDEDTAYPIKFDATAGATRVRVDGTITSLLKFTAMDVRLALAGSSLEDLYVLLGLAFPATRAYETAGKLVHSGNSWRYEKFAGHVGDSDIAGDLQVETGGKRTALKAELTSRSLDFADLGPMIGAKGVPVPGRVLPDLPFKTDRWDSVDAEVGLKAVTIRRAKELPLENLVAHLSLRDSVLKLAPLDFGVAGGHLSAVITLDGGKDPMTARAQLRARKILLAKLFPAVELTKASIGQVNGELDLAGKGNSVGRMLAGADGKVGMAVTGGEVSRLMMEKIGLHLLEILQLKMSGDTLVKLRCAVVDFDVKAGTMRAESLVFDTEVTTIIGTGSIDLATEKLDLILVPKTKNTSIVALRSPIHIRGSFAEPDIGVDKKRVALRAAGAAALALLNPLLVLVPLVDAGPGKNSDCGQLVRDARNLPRAEQKVRQPG